MYVYDEFDVLLSVPELDAAGGLAALDSALLQPVEVMNLNSPAPILSLGVGKRRVTFVGQHQQYIGVAAIYAPGGCTHGSTHTGAGLAMLACCRASTSASTKEGAATAASGMPPLVAATRRRIVFILASGDLENLKRGPGSDSDDADDDSDESDDESSFDSSSEPTHRHRGRGRGRGRGNSRGRGRGRV